MFSFFDILTAHRVLTDGCGFLVFLAAVGLKYFLARSRVPACGEADGMTEPRSARSCAS